MVANSMQMTRTQGGLYPSRYKGPFRRGGSHISSSTNTEEKPPRPSLRPCPLSIAVNALGNVTVDVDTENGDAVGKIPLVSISAVPTGYFVRCSQVVYSNLIGHAGQRP